MDRYLYRVCVAVWAAGLWGCAADRSATSSTGSDSAGTGDTAAQVSDSTFAGDTAVSPASDSLSEGPTGGGADSAAVPDTATAQGPGDTGAGPADTGSASSDTGGANTNSVPSDTGSADTDSASSDIGDPDTHSGSPTDTAPVSALWEQFVEAQRTGEEPILPDFSYAGYHFAQQPLPDVPGPVFDVTDFGALPDDDKEDVAGIQAAIDAARDAGGGVVFFPPGRFLINEAPPAASPRIRVQGGGIVLRGSGSGEGGTELFMKNNLAAADPNKKWTTPYVIEASGSTSSISGTRVARIVAPARRETTTVIVDDASGLSVGDWVIVWLEDPRAVTSDILAPFAVEPHWKDFNAGKLAQERKQIAAIDGNRLTFASPIRQSIDPAYDWEIRKYASGEEFGIEHLAMVGNWHEEFVHHKDDVHDGGWSAIRWSKYANGWIRDVRFRDWNRVISLVGVTATTVRDVVIEGNRGHSSIDVQAGSADVLVMDVHDRTQGGQWHAAGVSNHAAGTVFLRVSWPAQVTFDAHGGFPYATLYDSVTGGLGSAKSGSGGASENLPNHLWNLVLWNWDELGNPVRDYRFWRYPESPYYRCYLPVVVGIHGAASTFEPGQVAYDESHGTPVYPSSLYEAQRALRLGR